MGCRCLGRERGFCYKTPLERCIPNGDLEDPPTSPKVGIHCPCKGTKPALAPSTLPEGNDLCRCPVVPAPARPSATADFQPLCAEPPCLPCWWQQLLEVVCSIRNPTGTRHCVCVFVCMGSTGVLCRWHTGTSNARRGGHDVPDTSSPRKTLDLPAGAEPAAGSRIACLLFP